MENLGKILTALRMINSKRYTQPYVASCLKISQGQYSKIECGEKPLTMDQFILFAAMLRITPNALLECILLGEKNIDEAITKAVKIINKESSIPLNEREKEQSIGVISNFIETNKFDIIKQLINIIGLNNIETLRETANDDRHYQSATINS